jgi:60 kDa SS-A/Ro ribonucleoprotein
MQSPLTGHRRGATTKVRCVDVAALIATALLRKNPDAVVLPFEHEVVPVALDAEDRVLSNAARLAAVGGGGTSVSAPIVELVRRKARVDLVVIVSDNQSWCDASQGGGATATIRAFERLRRRNPRARLACIDLQPYGTTQAPERPDVLNVGGFSDSVFEVLADFSAGRLAPDHWSGVLAAVDLGARPS